MAESCTALGIIAKAAKKDPKVKNDYCHIVTKYLDPLIDNTWIAQLRRQRPTDGKTGCNTTV